VHEQTSRSNSQRNSKEPSPQDDEDTGKITEAEESPTGVEPGHEPKKQASKEEDDPLYPKHTLMKRNTTFADQQARQ